MSLPSAASQPKPQASPGPSGSNNRAHKDNGNSNAGNNSQKHRRSNSKSGFNNSGRRSNSSENVKQNKLSASEQSIVTKHMDDRTLYLLANSIGSKCIVTVTSGTRYMGLLYTTSSFLDSPLSIVLKFPELYSVASDDEIDINDEIPQTFYIDAKDLADIEILDLDLSSKHQPDTSIETPSPMAPSSNTNFKTDVDIGASSRNFTQSSERELEKWVPEEGDELLGGGLEDGSDSTKNWDQFAVNERKFGIQSSFNEDLYTTKISRNDPKYAERLARAEKLAKEIEGTAHNGNIHLAEERGIIVDDSGFDEEDKYSGVDRRGEELMAAIRSGAPQSTDSQEREFSPNKYVPPRLRAAQYHDDPAILSSTDINKLKVSTAEEEKKKLPSTLPEKPSNTSSKQSSFNSETSRINAQSEINALKEFSANFKIPTKFPKDLLPIVTKDKNKQKEILKKFEEEEAEKMKVEAEKKEKEKAKDQPPAPAPAKKKMDAKNAITFKMNPNTVAFQPSNFTPPTRSSFGSRSPATNFASPRSSHLSPGKKPATAAGFFGSRVPKEDNPNDKFQTSFLFFATVGSAEKLEKPFATGPTWEPEVDETHMNLYQLIPEKVNIPVPRAPNMRGYYPASAAQQSPMGVPPQLIPPVTPISPQHAQHSPIPLQTAMHPQAVPIMMPPPSFASPESANRNLSPSPQAGTPYYPGFVPAGHVAPMQSRPPPEHSPSQQPPQPQAQQNPSTSPRMQRSGRHHSNSGGSGNGAQQAQVLQQQQQQAMMAQRAQMAQMMAAQQQGQYPMFLPMPPQGGQYQVPRNGNGAAAPYPQMGYYVVGPPNGRQF